MYADFMWVAADQLFNQIGKARHMFGGEGKVPFVLRSKIAMGTGYGSQHSMDPAGIFATAPGWRIVAPSTPFDYVGLMNTALACDDPVVVLEHVDLYDSTGPGVPDEYDHYLPVGKAAIRRKGEALTDPDLRRHDASPSSTPSRRPEWRPRSSIFAGCDRASLDWDTISASIEKTNRVLIAEQGAVGTSYGGWLSDEIQRRLFDWLDAPIERVTGGEASPSISKVLERAAFARTEEVVAKLQQMAGGVTMPEIIRMPESRGQHRRGRPRQLERQAEQPYAVGDPLVTVETDKAVVDVEAEIDGMLLRAAG